MAGYDDVAKMALECGFYFPGCEVYGDSQAGFWEYGPNGVGLKNKFIQLWRRELVRRAQMIEIDGAQIMSKSVFAASGHLEGFADPIVRCEKCGLVFRADRMLAEASKIEIPEGAPETEFDAAISENHIKCTKCGGTLSKTSRFNMMFKVGIGPAGEQAYLRPETCQSIFVDFPRLYKTMRGRLPLGIAQIGKSFRNEISPRQGILRLREFYQAEIEVFYNPAKTDSVPLEEVKDTVLRIHTENTSEMTCEKAVDTGVIPTKLMAYYMALLVKFYEKTGIDASLGRFRKLGEKEKAFYAKSAFDYEVETATGWLELVACNDRADHDLAGHARGSGSKFEVMDGDSKVLPHVFEMSMGIDRSLYTILEHCMRNDKENERAVLALRPYLAPVQVGVLSLVKKDGLKEKADEIFKMIRGNYDAFLDHSGAIGRRYRRLDEIGVPYAVTIDHRTLEDGTVTLRERDTMEQRRIRTDELESHLHNGIYGRDV